MSSIDRKRSLPNRLNESATMEGAAVPETADFPVQPLPTTTSSINRIDPDPSPRAFFRRIAPGLVVLASYLAVAVLGGLFVWSVTHSTPAEPPKASWPTRTIPNPINTPPRDYPWADQPDPEFPIPPYAEHLQGVRIVLDPGHIGQDDRNKGPTWKRGPTGLREKDVNLRVAQFLSEFLTAAGADVTLTRSTDTNLKMADDDDLLDRAEVANRLNADLFLSIHHNGADDPKANHTSLFFHAEPESNPASVGAARYLLNGLADALRLETHLPTAVLSDHLLYKREGLAVLRHARVPAVLSEASFHSNPEEEARLRDPVYNRREAYGLFLGLARWAQAGLPRVSLGAVNPPASNREGSIVVKLDDGLSKRGGWGRDTEKILRRSINVRADGKPVEYQFDPAKDLLTIPLPRGSKLPRELSVDFQNLFGQHVVHPILTVR